MRLVGIDIGGTFTDLALYDSDDGSVTVHKLPSTPDDPGRALVRGVLELCSHADVTPGEIAGVLHGTTVATNAVLEHDGAPTGMITTDGVRDVLHIGRHQRPEPYSVMLDIPWQSQPFVERSMRLAVPERIAPPDGEVIQELDEDAVRDAATALAEQGAEAVAVCFLFSYLDPAHEVRAQEIVREVLPDAFVCSSAEIVPQFREFERFTTTCMNAFVGPGTGAYLDRLDSELKREGVDAEVLVMRSNGGVASVAEAAARPVTLMLSGPAAGVLGASWAAGLVGRERLVTFDMGGTSADIAILTESGIPEASARDTEIAGHPLLVPMFDIRTIGAGGGSIAWIDRGGAFKVGPESAGARPGPACYGHGGDRPTITDAHLVLGRLDPDLFLGGQMKLHPDKAAAVIEDLASRLELTPVEAAEGILTIANASMAQTIRSITVERGRDPRDFSLVAFGGAGPLHAAELAEELGMKEVLVPPHPGITSAAGLLTSDLRYDQMRTVLQTDHVLEAAEVERLLVELEDDLVASLERDGVPRAEISLERGLDCRYVGQGYELRIPLEGEFSVDVLEDFHGVHRAEYGRHLDDPIELVNVRVVARGRRPKLERVSVTHGSLEQATVGEAPGVWRVDGQLAELSTLRVNRESMPLDEPIPGPAVIFQPDATIAVPPQWGVRASGEGTLVLKRDGGSE